FTTRAVAKVNQVLTVWLIVMLLHLDTRIIIVLKGRRQPDALGFLPYDFSKLSDGISLLELIKYPVFAGICWILDCKSQTSDGVAQRQNSTALSAGPINSQRVLDNRLTYKTIDCRAETGIKIEAGHQPR